MSQVIATNSEPTILYHGTTADFSTFRNGLIWLTEDPNYAERGEDGEHIDEGAWVELFPAELKLLNYKANH